MRPSKPLWPGGVTDEKDPEIGMESLSNMIELCRIHVCNFEIATKSSLPYHVTLCFFPTLSPPSADLETLVLLRPWRLQHPPRSNKKQFVSPILMSFVCFVVRFWDRSCPNISFSSDSDINKSGPPLVKGPAYPACPPSSTGAWLEGMPSKESVVAITTALESLFHQAHSKFSLWSLVEDGRTTHLKQAFPKWICLFSQHYSLGRSNQMD